MGAGIKIEVNAGELVDRLTISLLKFKSIEDLADSEQKLKQIGNDVSQFVDGLAELQEYLDLLPTIELLYQAGELFRINKELWKTEDALREKEAEKDFDEEFVELARSVYILNDQRHKAKSKIAELTNTGPSEIKQYKGEE